MGEFDRIARLAQRFGSVAPPSLGIGDDCAVLAPTRFATALSVDASVEGVHFSREWITLDRAAERAVEAALSDLAAMGATVAYVPDGGCGILSALTLPRTLGEDDFDALVEGIARASERVGARVLGGNLAAGPVITLTTTVVGRIEGRTVTRAGASPGDVLCVTGTPGAAALGLRALQAGRGDDPRFAPFVAAWRTPRARLHEGVAMARFASAAIDISDGLAQDAGHLARASRCAVVLDLARLPLSESFRDAARALGADPVALALAGGEDYELCFAARSLPALPAGLATCTVIGELVAGDGVHVRDAQGTRPLRHEGFDHFA